jgi:hypothetical protein
MYSLTLFALVIKLIVFFSLTIQDVRQVIPRYQPSSAVLASIREKLVSAWASNPQEILDAIVEALSEGRGYAWIGIYLAVESQGVWQAASGPAPASIDVSEVKTEIAVPIRLGARTLGLIVAKTGRGSTSGQGARQERVLLQQTAKLVAQYLTTNRAKQLLRKTRKGVREAARSDPRETGAGREPRTTTAKPHKSPQSARPVARRAAAGERIPR